ncbi:C-type lectin domain family 2 member H-like [Lithobates pipiens]
MEKPTSPNIEEMKRLNGPRGLEESIEMNVSNGTSNGINKPGATASRKALQCFTHNVPCYWIPISIVFVLVSVIVGTAIYVWSTSKSEPLCPAWCSADWILMNGSCYYLSDGKKNWTDSQRLCNNYGGSLVIIRNNTKEDLKKLNTHDDFWIGLGRDQNKWKWIDGTYYTEEVEEYRDDIGLNCAFLNSKIMALDCATHRRFICSKTASGVKPDLLVSSGPSLI